jgi:hypothetical protein
MIIIIGDDRGSKIKVLFCGKDHFKDGYYNTKVQNHFCDY